MRLPRFLAFALLWGVAATSIGVSSVHAETVFTARAAEGSKSSMELTDEEVAQCPKSTYRATATTHDGRKVDGCWVYNGADDTVTFIEIPSYTTYKIPAKVFTRVTPVGTSL